MSSHLSNASPETFGHDYLAIARRTFLERFMQNGQAPCSDVATAQILDDYGQLCATAYFEQVYPALADAERQAQLADGQALNGDERRMAHNFVGLTGLLSRDSWLLEHRGHAPRFDRLGDGQREDVMAHLFGESLGVLGVIHERRIYSARVPVRFTLLHSVAELETMDSSRWT